MSAHERALSLGGLPGIPNLGLVESAIARPYSGHHRSIQRKAAALVDSMARNHGFADGNKRTTVILLHMLLERSGYALVKIGARGSIQTEIENMILDVIDRRMSFDDLTAWMAARILAK